MGIVLRVGNRKAFEEAIRRLARRHRKKYTDKYRIKINQLLRKLAKATPVDTGAAKGDDAGAKRELYKQHPAYRLGLSIGNEVGESGWQVIETVSKSGAVQFSIVNPMWDYYLKYVEFTSGGEGYGAVRMIFAEFQESI